MNAIIPIPRCELTIRPATMSDLPFMDGLQKAHGRALGYFPTKQFEGYIETGGVLIAEESGSEAVGGEAVKREDSDRVTASPLHRVTASPLHRVTPSLPLGYIISRDRYLKRDELGVIFQLCVEQGKQRKLVGAALVKEVFERSAYGCRLYCCWCAQDLEANYFWESMGFVPVAFRAGSTGKRRVHIFWQRRIGAGDETTPYWYPFQTSSGAIREDRLVFPIPPGVHWKDVQAVRLPAGGPQKRVSGLGSRVSGEKKKRISSSARKPKLDARDPNAVAIVVGGRIRYIARPGYVAQPAASAPAETPAETPVATSVAMSVATSVAKEAKPKRVAAQIDPKYLAAARELRDRYLEQLNTTGLLPAAGKYDVARALPAPDAPAFGAPRALPMAA